MNPDHYFFVPMAYLILWSIAGIRVLTTFIEGEYHYTLAFGIIMIWFAYEYSKTKNFPN